MKPREGKCLYFNNGLPSGMSDLFLRSPSNIASTIAEMIVRTKH